MLTIPLTYFVTVSTKESNVSGVWVADVDGVLDQIKAIEKGWA